MNYNAPNDFARVPSAIFNRLHTVVEEDEVRRSEKVVAETHGGQSTDSIPTLSTEYEVSPAETTSALFLDSSGFVAESTPKDQRPNGWRASDPIPLQQSSINYISSSTASKKASRRQRKPNYEEFRKSNEFSVSSGRQAGSRRSNPTQFSEMNNNHNLVQSKGIRPLVLVKKQKRNENVNPYELVRSATNKARALLRKGEVLPQVVVRPPSNGDGTIFS